MWWRWWRQYQEYYLQLGLKCGKYGVGVYSPAGEGASRQKGRLRRRGVGEWAFLAYRTLRANRQARLAPLRQAAAANGGAHWNEERRVPAGAVPRAVKQARGEATASCPASRGEDRGGGRGLR